MGTVLRNVVREVMRLYPVAAAGSARVIGKDFETPQGYILPKGSLVFMPYFVAHRNKEVFGDDADSFIPSRWENPSEEMNKAFLPFAAGKQNCIGQSLAMAEMLNIVPRIIAEFELELVDEGIIEYFVTLKPRNVMVKA